MLGVFLVIAALGAEGLWVYATRVEPRRLTMRRYELESELVPRSVRPIRIVVLSDLQTDRVGDFEARVFEAVASERPDLLLLPGDFLQCDGDEAYEEERRKLAALFAKIDPWPRLGAIAVDGDTDSSRETLAETRVRVIEDEGLRLTDRVQVWGLSSLASRDELDTDALQYCQQFPGLTIVLGHSPDFFAPMIESGITFPVLCVAGHTHGGQVVVPFYGPPITLSRLPRDVAAGGFFTSGDASLVLSRGVGMERGYAPRLRFLCPPELVVVEITGVGPGS